MSREDMVAKAAEAMEAEYEAQMAADNDGSPLPCIDWPVLAEAAVDAVVDILGPPF